MTRINLLFMGFLLSAGSLARADDASKAANIGEFLKAAKFDQSLQQTLNMGPVRLKRQPSRKYTSRSFRPNSRR